MSLAGGTPHQGTQGTTHLPPALRRTPDPGGTGSPPSTAFAARPGREPVGADRTVGERAVRGSPREIIGGVGTISRGVVDAHRDPSSRRSTRRGRPGWEAPAGWGLVRRRWSGHEARPRGEHMRSPETVGPIAGVTTAVSAVGGLPVARAPSRSRRGSTPPGRAHCVATHPLPSRGPPGCMAVLSPP